jgi:misacylated tRNA(Ala) deacylase
MAAATVGRDMTERLFLHDPLLAAATARVLASGPAGIVLDRTVFYARGDGQPGDTGMLRWEGQSTSIADTVKGDGDAILHLPSPAATLPGADSSVEAVLDWPRRERLMRMHTALHLLCSLIPGAAVTGGQVGGERSRLDFDLPDPPRREELEERLNALIAADHPVVAEWVDEAVLDANPDLVRTLSVKPPRGAGRVRLIRIGARSTPIDLQPCGGTHVAATGVIGGARVLKIESKGRQNRRIVIALAGAEAEA